MDLNSGLTIYGPLGIGVVVMAYVIINLNSERKAKDLEIRALYDRIAAIQEERIKDARETRDRIGEQMEVSNRVVGLIYDKLYDVKKGA